MKDVSSLHEPLIRNVKFHKVHSLMHYSPLSKKKTCYDISIYSICNCTTAKVYNDMLIGKSLLSFFMELSYIYFK